MEVTIDQRCDNEPAAGVDGRRGVELERWADPGEASTLNGEVEQAAVDEACVADDEIGHRSSPICASVLIRCQRWIQAIPKGAGLMTALEPLAEVPAEVREGTYGDRVGTVEPGGAEFIPLSDRHGKPRTLFGTWTSPNLEFATVFVGVISISFFGQTFWQAVAAIVLGTALGSLSHGVLSGRGPSLGVPQMVQSRISFGFLGNLLPAGLNSLTAGIGWFAVNSVSGALALNALTGVPSLVCLVFVALVQTAIAFVGHNLVQLFERWAFPLLGAAFVLASVEILSKSHPGSVHGTGGTGGFLLSLGAAFGYACGWNPYAADYTRYFPPNTSRMKTGLVGGVRRVRLLRGARDRRCGVGDDPGHGD